MTTYEAIKLLIEEDVRCDIHGDLYGHERVAENEIRFIRSAIDMMERS